MKDRLPVFLALLVLGVLSAFIAVRSRRSATLADAPERVIANALTAATAGDVEGYLSCFTGTLRSALERAVAETGRDAYGASLRQRGKAMTGWAVSVLPATSGSGDVRLRVDVVFRDRNEVQDYVVRRDGTSWRIADLGPASTARMPIAYGTAVGAEQAASPAGRTGETTP